MVQQNKNVPKRKSDNTVRNDKKKIMQKLDYKMQMQKRRNKSKRKQIRRRMHPGNKSFNNIVEDEIEKLQNWASDYNELTLDNLLKMENTL